MKIDNKEFLNPQQQLYENTKDIEKLKADYQPVYNSIVELYEDDTPAETVLLSNTNAPAGTKSGWILDPNGYLFKITDGSTTTLLIQYYSMIKGPQGETGETGAQGEQGIQGVQGEQGPQGPTGRNMLYCGTTVNRTEDYEGVVQKTYIDTYLPTGVTVNVGDLFVNIEGILCQVKSIQTNYYGYKNLKRISGDKIFYTDLTLNSTIGNSTNIPWANIIDGTGTTRSYWNTFKDSLIIDSNGMLGQATDTYLGNGTIAGLKFKSIVSLKGPQGQATIGIQVVAQLPVSGTEGIIYLIPAEDPKTGNAYDEYIYTNNAWEKFGYVDIDLSNYIQKSSTSGLVKNDGTIDTNTYATTSQLPTYTISNVVTDQSDVLGLQVTDGSVTANINNTTANPTLVGTESDLASIDIGGTFYKVPNPTVNNSKITLKQNNASASFYLNQNADSEITLLTVQGNTSETPTAALSDLKIGTTVYSVPTGTAASCNTGTAAGNVPVLDANGKLPDSVMPALSISETFVVNSQASMLALTAQQGDVCVRTDLNKSYILTNNTPGTLANWQELLTPTDAVTSVQGRTGAVTITQADLNIVYSATQPSNPVTGTIWIAPAS